MNSMGGAIAARTGASGKIKNLLGVVVVDVVEGTALAALSHMQNILENRPKSFDSIHSAIEWSVSSGMLKKLESARLSIPSQLVERDGKYFWRTNLPKSEPHWKGTIM
jgi:protein phosphatase methylesterase 1